MTDGDAHIDRARRADFLYSADDADMAEVLLSSRIRGAAVPGSTEREWVCCSAGAP
jgi:hypothetical protein